MGSAKLAELPAAARQLAIEEDATKKMIGRVRKGQAPPVPASPKELTIEGERAQRSAAYERIIPDLWQRPRVSLHDNSDYISTCPS